MIGDLAESVAVITGAGSGIGRACAEALARRGTRVIASDIDFARARDTTVAIQAAGGTAHPVACDVTRDVDVERLREDTLAHYGRIDIVMNNVGVIAVGAPQNLPVTAWTRTFDVNVVSIARALAVFLPGLLDQGRGHVINTASTSALWPYGYDRLPYAASKGAIVALSESLALYCNPRGIGVTCLCPGPVRTGIADTITVFGDPQPVQRPPLALLEPAAVAQQVVDAIETNTFFLPTHPEVRDIIRRRAEDIDAFLTAQVAALPNS
jgi:NAD(P)-dependent dehydrogenase (short-subunit alcohol dehydrogenase family)